MVLRWELQRGVLVNPRSWEAAHMAENLDVFGFSLDDSDDAAIAGVLVPGPVPNNKVCPDPTTIP